MNEIVLKYLDRQEVMDAFDAILKKYSLENSKAAIFSLLQQVIDGELTTVNFFDALSDILPNIDQGVLVDADADIYEKIFLPVEDEIENAFESKKKNFDELVNELITNHSLIFNESRLSGRFRNILEQYLRGEYDEDRAKRALMKGIKPGGLELSEEVAESIMSYVRGLQGHVRFSDEKIALYKTIVETDDIISSTNSDNQLESKQNNIQKTSDLPMINQPHELAETQLIDTPEELTKNMKKNASITRLRDNQIIAAKKLVDALTPLEKKEEIKKKNESETVTEDELVFGEDINSEAQNLNEIFDSESSVKKTKSIENDNKIVFGDESTQNEQQEPRVKQPLSFDEKARRNVREKAQHISYKKARIPSAPANILETPKKVTTINNSEEHALCEVVNDKELEELYEAERFIKDETSEVDTAHEEIKKTFLEVVIENKTPLSHVDLCERFYHIIMARLKDVRDAYNTREIVMKESEDGGLGFTASQAQQFLDLLEKKKTALHEHWLAIQKQKKDEYVKQRRESLFKVENNSADARVATNRNTSDVVGIAQIEKMATPTTVIAKHLQTSKPIMHDVHASPQLLDPIGELKSYTIEDFHRLHSDPKEASLRIEQKLNLLGDWMYSKRYKGIEAWKESEVMKIYREQLQQSIIVNLPLSEVIEKRKVAGQLFLTIEEVSALTELNARLRK